MYSGDAYTLLHHGIAPRDADVLHEGIVNLEDDDHPGERIPRAKRWSLVFVRKLNLGDAAG